MEYIKASEIEGSTFNSPDRVKEDKHLSMIIDSMRKDGFWPWMPIIIGKDGKIADGHRRLAAARILGIDEVPVERVKKETAEIWGKINGMRLNIRSGDYAYAYTNGFPSDAWEMFPHDVLAIRQIGAILNIGGEALIRKLVDTKTSPGVIVNANGLANYCGEKGNRDFLALCINWLIDHKMNIVVRAYIITRQDPIFLYKSVLNNLPVILTPGNK